MSFDEIDSVLNGLDLFLLVVRNFDAERVFKSHDQFNGVKRVCTEVGDESAFILDIGFIDAELFSDDLLNLLFNIVPLKTSFLE